MQLQAKGHPFAFLLRQRDGAAPWAPPCPFYPSRVARGLYLGPLDSCRDARAMRDLGITDVVAVLTERESPAPPAWLVAPARHFLRCSCEDSLTADLTPVLERALPFIQRALDANRRILVHCMAGQSRSAAVVVAHMVIAGAEGARAVTVQDALQAVRQARPLVQPNPNFMRQLQSFSARWRAAAAVPAGADGDMPAFAARGL